MSDSDYDIHLRRDQFDRLWESESDTYACEDTEELDRILNEELTRKRPIRKRRVTSK